MEFNPVGEAIVALHVKDILARIGYPGKLMPHVTEPLVAVNLHKMTPEGATVVAAVCVPMNMGVNRCERMAKDVANAWTRVGFTVNYGSHQFDGKSGLYLTSVYGYLPRPVEETEET
jgi:hypothetical protein